MLAAKELQDQPERRSEYVELLAKANELYRQSEMTEPGSGLYNLICVASLLHDEAACRQWMQRRGDLALEELVPSSVFTDQEHLDPDLGWLCSQRFEWFVALIEQKPQP